MKDIKLKNGGAAWRTRPWSMTNKIPVIFDTDPGIDDAAALTVLLTDDRFDVKLITAVAGNVSVDKTTKNVLKLTHFFNRPDVAVARGAAKPLVKAYQDAANIHGVDGLAGYHFAEPSTKTVSLSAVEAMRATLLASDEKITLVAVGAYTNIAMLLQSYPEVTDKIARIVVMGGSLSGGNMTSVAEFNDFTDPDAAKIVFNSGLDVTMIGLDVTLKALLTAESMATLATMNKTGEMLTALFNAYGDGSMATGKPMHDVNTLFYLLSPEKYTIKDYWVDVVTDGPAIGATVADSHARTHTTTNVHVATDIDVAAFNAWYLLEIAQINDAAVNAGKLEN